MKSPLYVFYSWNEYIEKDELRAQMKDFSARGVTGVFIHARAGLCLPYFGEEWFAAFGVALETAKSLGMEVGIYDENGWPSGFGNGAVNGLGERYMQKRLRVEKTFKDGANMKLLSAYRKADDTYVRCDVKDGELFAFVETVPEYVDLLAPCVTDAFIDSMHEVYRKRFG